MDNFCEALELTLGSTYYSFDTNFFYQIFGTAIGSAIFAMFNVVMDTLGKDLTFNFGH